MSTRAQRIRFVPASRPAGNTGMVVESTPDVEVLAGDGVATITDGLGGQWETVARPHRVGLTRYVGRSPLVQDVPILIDGFAGDGRVNLTLEILLDAVVTARTDREPTVWRVQGPIHYPDRRWVIGDIQMGDALRSEAGLLVRQELSVSLMEWVAGDKLTVRRKPLKLKPRKRKVGAKISANGKTLRQLAKQHYGNVKAAKPLGLAQKPPVKDLGKKLHRKIKLVRVRIP